MWILVSNTLDIPLSAIGDALLCATQQGKTYIDALGRCYALDSLWQRFMEKMMEKSRVTECFQERDLRAKVASESNSLIEASECLSHADTAITQQAYRHRSIRIQPLNNKHVNTILLDNCLIRAAVSH